MRAAFVVEALFCNAQAFHGLATDEVLLDDGLGVFRFDIAVPNRFRVNHDSGSVFALVEAAGLVDAHFAGQPCGFGKLLQPGVQVAFAV